MSPSDQSSTPAADAPQVPSLSIPIETQRLVLRDYTAEDAAAVHKMLQEPSYWQHQTGDKPELKIIEALMTWAEQEQNMSPRLNYYLAATLKGSNELIGEGVLKITDARHGQGEIGFGIAKQHWNQGYASEIGKALMGHGFKTLNLHRIQSVCSPENKGAIRTLQKLGMGREGLMREVAHVKGRWWSSVVYAMIDHEYAKISALQGP